MDEDEIYAALTAIFRKLFRDPSMTLAPTLSAKDVQGWDSIKMIKVILAVEEHFDIRLLGRETDALRNVRDLVALIYSHVNK